MVGSIPHLSSNSHWVVKDHHLEVVSDKQNVFSRIGAWIKGATTSPQKVFQEFAALIRQPEEKTVKELYQYKADIEKEYTYSVSKTWRLTSALWSGGTLEAKEAALDATYSQLDRLLFGDKATYETLTTVDDKSARRQAIDKFYEQITSTSADQSLDDFDLGQFEQLERGPKLKELADLGYPGAQLAMTQLLQSSECEAYGLKQDEEQLIHYTTNWLEAQGTNPSALFERAVIKSNQGMKPDTIIPLLDAAIAQKDAKDVPKMMRLRGQLKLDLKSPADQLSGYQDLIAAARSDDKVARKTLRDLGMGALAAGKRFPTDDWPEKFRETFPDQINQVNSAVWLNTIAVPQDNQEALYLRGKIGIASADDQERFDGWSNMLLAANLGSSKAVKYITEQCDKSLADDKNRTSPLPAEHDDFTEEFAEANKAHIDNLSSGLWLIYAKHNHDFDEAELAGMPPDQAGYYAMGATLPFKAQAEAFLVKAPDVPQAVLLRALWKRDKSEVIRLVAPLLVNEGLDAEIHEDARNLLQARLPFPLSKPQENPKLWATQPTLLIQAKEALFNHGQEVWYSPRKDIFKDDKPEDPANKIKDAFRALKRPLLNDPNHLSQFQKELLHDLISFLHGLSQLEAGTNMGAQQLAEQWAPILYPELLSKQNTQILAEWIRDPATLAQ